MDYCKKCGAPAPKDHEVCWMCEHEERLTPPSEEEDEHCGDDSCPIDHHA